MYEILFESSFKILAYGLFLAVPLVVMAFHFQDKRLWMGTGAVCGLILICLVVEWWVVTPTEEVKSKISQIAQVVENNDVEGLLKHISQKKKQVVARAGNEMPSYDFSVCNVMQFHGVKIDPNNPRRATADFMVRFNLSMRGYAGGGLRDVVLVFEKEDDDQWRIVDYSHYDPMNREGRQNFFY